MTQTGTLGWVITLLIMQGSSPFQCTPTLTLTFHSTSTPSISMTTLYSILPVHSNRILRSRQLPLRSITMVRFQHTRILKWVPLSIPQSIIRHQGLPTPLQLLHRNRYTTTSICISVVRTPICGTSDSCRTTPAIGPPTCPLQCSLNTYTTPPTKPCLTQAQALLRHRPRILPLLLFPCSMSILLKSFTPSIPIHNRMV